MADDDQPTREELLAARARLKQQLALAANPVRSQDYDRELCAKLRGMIKDIEDCLAEPEPEKAPE
jgi:hypothetical protein